MKQCHGDSVIVAQSLSILFTDKVFIIINKNDHKRVWQSFLDLKLAVISGLLAQGLSPVISLWNTALSTLPLKSFNL